MSNTIEFCKECVISNMRPITTVEAMHKQFEVKPTTRFVDGVCDACRWAKVKDTSINWESREAELQTLCDRHRSKNNEFDVIVPASGGKDSCYVAHLLKHKYGMKPLTVTWAPNIPTETGRRNLANMIKSGFDNIFISPNGKVHRYLTRLAFENLGHPFQPFIFGQRTVGPRVALQYGIKLVFYGENVAEYGNRLEDNFSPLMDPKLFTCYNLDDPNTRLAGVSVPDLTEHHGISRSDLQMYHAPSQSEISKAGVDVHYMSYYRKWDPQANYFYAMTNTDFQPSEKRSSGSFSRYSGLDDKLEWFHYYMMYVKFGMGRATADAAQEVRTGRMTRAEAIAVVTKFDGEFPSDFFEDFLEYTGLTALEFENIVDKFRSPRLWEKFGSEWRLIETVK